MLDAGATVSPEDAVSALSAEDVLELQRTAGNRAVAATLQRAPAGGAAGTAAGAPAGARAAGAAAGSGQAERSDYADLFNGFTELAVAAVNQGGRGLDTVRLGPDLSRGHRVFLERVRRVLIQAQASSADERREAAAAWPSLAGKLQADLGRARQLGIGDDQLAAIADNIALVGERYVHVRHRGPAETENPADYADLMTGIQQLLDVVDREWTDRTDAVVPLNLAEVNARQRDALGAVQLGSHLSRRHRALLDNLRTSLILARTEAPGSVGQSLRLWNAVQGDLRHAFRRAPRFVDGDVTPIQQELARIGAQLIHGGVYSEAHNRALSEEHLASPDIVFQIERFKEASKGVEEAQKLAKKGMELTGVDVIDQVLSEDKWKGGLGSAIFELVKYPGEVAEKLEEFKKADKLTKTITIVDLVDKTQSFGRALGEVSFEVVKRFADKALEVAVHNGEAEVAKRWWKVSDWCAERLETLEKIGKVATWVTVVISAVKVVDYIRQGEWAKAASELGQTLAGLGATFAGGAGGAATFGGIAVVVAAEAEGLAGAAAMLRYCRKESIRDAAEAFVGVCTDASTLVARDLVADVKLLDDPSMASERPMIEQRLMGYVPYWLRDIEKLSDQIRDDRSIRLGGQPDLRDALGPEALKILRDPGSWAGGWETMAEQIRVIFAGASAMAKLAVERYGKIDEIDRPKKKEGEGGE